MFALSCIYYHNVGQMAIDSIIGIINIFLGLKLYNLSIHWGLNKHFCASYELQIMSEIIGFQQNIHSLCST